MVLVEGAVCSKVPGREDAALGGGCEEVCQEGKEAVLGSALPRIKGKGEGGERQGGL